MDEQVVKAFPLSFYDIKLHFILFTIFLKVRQKMGRSRPA